MVQYQIVHVVDFFNIIIFTQYNYVGINTEPDQDDIGNRTQPTLDLGVDGQTRR